MTAPNLRPERSRDRHPTGETAQDVQTQHQFADRELLELAAKAAGIRIIRSRLDDPMHKDMLIENSARNPGQASGPWNPRDDDGDKARLEAKLDLSVLRLHDMVAVSYRSAFQVRENFAEYFADHAGDKQAARRLAGVRAAAEIGKTIP